MAFLEVFRSPSNNYIPNPLDGFLTVSTDSLIEVTLGSFTFRFLGSGFTWDEEESLVGGTLTGFEMWDANAGGIVNRVTGLNQSVFDFVAGLLYGGVPALMLTWLAGNDTVTGYSGADELHGYGGRDSISGGAGDDVLYGADDYEIDTLAGGAGNDTYYVGGQQDASNDVVVELPGGGHDTVVSLSSFTLGADIEDLVISGPGMANGYGNALDNDITGNSANNLLEGGAGNDTLDGGAGGADTLRGGTGNDEYYVRISGTLVDETGGGGIDTIVSEVSFALDADFEHLRLVGNASLLAIGNEFDNVITGNNGYSTLDGGAGKDTLIGGAAGDTFIVDNLGDVVIDNGTAVSPPDTVRALVDGYVIGGAIENLELGGNAVTGSGSAIANRITGNVLANVLYGNGGNDTIDGGAGADTMAGGEGDDEFIVDNEGDRIAEFFAAGTDRAVASVDYTLGAYVEHLVLVGNGLRGTGNGQANRITGTDGNDTLDGGAGADTLVGGGGSDTYIIDAGDVVQDLDYYGDADTIISSASYNLASAVGIENLTLSGTANINATGNVVANVLTGNDGDNVLTAVAGLGWNGDTLIGGRGRDSLVGSEVEDRLDGGAGADTMRGGTGRDVYVVDDAADVVIEQSSFISGGEGDVIEAWVSYTMPQHVEFLTLKGSAPIDGFGSAMGNETITGNDAANMLGSGGGSNDDLYGLGGDDTLDDEGGYARMYGGLGNDTYIVRGSLNWMMEEQGEGIDTVRAWADHTLRQNIEHLVLLGSAISGNGNAERNRITGNALDNFIDGGWEADTMEGGFGNDQYYVDNVGDVVIERDGEGEDTIIVTNGSYSLAGTFVERLDTEFTYANLKFTGNASANFLRTSNGNDTLDGGAGADTMVGYTGSDVYIVDNVGDVIWEVPFPDNDWVWTTLASYTLQNDIEHLKLLAGAVSGTGNDGDNIMLGNAGNNVLAGGAGRDNLMGGLGDDTLDGGAQNDMLDGDAGKDVAVFAGNRSEYTITRNDGRVMVSRFDGEDMLTGIDVIAFADQQVVLNTNFATGLVTISGAWREGATLTASTSGVADADGIGSIAWQWFRGGTQIPGEVGQSYLLAREDAGQAISVRARFVDGLGNTESLWSAPTGSIEIGDHVAPTVLSFQPADGATAIAPDANIVLKFSEPIKLGAGFIFLRDGNNSIVESFGEYETSRMSFQGDTLTIDPTSPLSYSTSYRLVFTQGNIQDLAGNGYAGSTSYDFRTMDAPDFTAPTVTWFTATLGGATPALTTNFSFSFSENVLRGNGNVVLKTVGGTVVETFNAANSNRLTVVGDNVVVDPTASLVAGTGYRLEFTAGALKDAAGNGTAAWTSQPFSTAPNILFGTLLDNTVAGTAGGDSIDAGDGNDTILGSAGADTVDGGWGMDVVRYTGARPNYTITHVQGGFTVASKTDADDVDTLMRVERLVFDDRKVAFDIDGNAGQAYRLYQAAFDRAPDIGGLGYQMNDLDHGWALTWVAGNFIASPEFQATYGQLNDTQFVTQLYWNVLDRAPDADGLAYHVNRLKEVPRSYILAGFSESDENKANVIGAIENGMDYIL